MQISQLLVDTNYIVPHNNLARLLNKNRNFKKLRSQMLEIENLKVFI